MTYDIEKFDMVYASVVQAVKEAIQRSQARTLHIMNDEVITMQYDDYGHEKYRIQFSYNGTQYDFPLTDTRYIHALRSRIKNCGQRNTGDLYLTLSLGVNHYDWHYKLVAGVIDLAA